MADTAHHSWTFLVCFLLKITETYSFTVPETRSPKPRGEPGHAPSKVSRGGFFLVSSSFDSPGVPWLVTASLQCLPLSSHGLLLSVTLSVTYRLLNLRGGIEALTSPPLITD